MKETRFPLLLGFLWEVLRFLLLFLAVAGQGGWGSRPAVLWLILFGSGQLALPAGLLFLYFDGQKYRSLYGFLVLGKLTTIFSALLLLLLEPVRNQVSSWIHLPLLSIAPLVLLWVVLFLDLLVLGILLSYRRKPSPQEAPRKTALSAPPPGEGAAVSKGVPESAVVPGRIPSEGQDLSLLPDYRETKIENGNPRKD
jgi:hypothetical protein